MADYSFYRQIVVDNTKVDETDSGFAVLLNLTASGSGIITDLKTTGNSGDIQNTDASGGASGSYTVPADLTFRTSVDLTEAGASLDFEIEYYDATTGDLIAWVQSGVIVDTDVDIYMVYGNAGVATSQENVTGVWPSNSSIWHLNQGNANQVDSKGGNDLTKTGTLTDIAGPIGRGISATFSNTNKLTKTSATSLPTDAQTLSVWYAAADNPTGDYTPTIFRRGQSGVDTEHFLIGVSKTDGYATGLYKVDTNARILTDDADIADGSWHKIDFTRNGANYELYVDGVSQGSNTDGDTGNLTMDKLYLGWGGNPDFDYLGVALLDELRYVAAERSADWIATSYNNQSSPDTFYSVGDQIPTVLQPTGIASTEAFGTPALALILQPAGIASAEALGTAGVGVWGADAGMRWGDGTLWGDSTVWGDRPGWGTEHKWGTGVLWGQRPLEYPRGNHIRLEIRTSSGTNYTSNAIDTAWRIESVLAQRISRAYFTFRVTSASAIDDHDEVIITDQSQTRLFAGFVESFEARPDGVEIEYSVVCVDYSWLMDHPNQLVTKIYESGTSDAEIIGDVMTKYCPEIGIGGVGCCAEELEREYYENMTPRQIIDALCKRSGAVWYVDYGGAGSYKATLHYFLPGAAASSGLTLADGIHLDPPPYPYGDLVKRREHGTCTEVIVEGRPTYVEAIEATIPVPEEDAGDPGLAARTRIKLPYKLKPLDGEIRPLVWVGVDTPALKVGYGGTQDLKGDPDSDGFDVLWFNDDKYLEFYGAPGLASSVYAVRYSALELRPTRGVASDAVGAAKYGRVLRTRVHDETIQDSDTAQLMAEALLDRWKADQDTYTCVFWEHGARAGQTINLTNTDLGISDDFIIQRLSGRGIGGDLWEYELELGKYIPDAVDTLRDLAIDKVNRDELEKGKGKPPVIGQIMFSMPGEVTGDKADDVPWYICAVNNLQILGTQLVVKTAPSGGDAKINLYRYFSDPDHEYYGLWYSVYNYGEWPTIAAGETVGTDGNLSTIAGKPWLREGDMLQLEIEAAYGAEDLTVSVKVRQ